MSAELQSQWMFGSHLKVNEKTFSHLRHNQGNKAGKQEAYLLRMHTRLAAHGICMLTAAQPARGQQLGRPVWIALNMSATCVPTGKKA